MFRDRPLTWLFLVATVIIDLPLVIDLDDPRPPGEIVVGYVLGQVATLAIWTVRGHIHRLLRVSCFVLATGLLARILTYRPSDLTLVYVIAAVIFLAALLVEIVRVLQDVSASNIDQKKRWQFPLIELFGWTIVVAFIGLGSRDMEFEDFIAFTYVVFLAAIIVVPLLIVFFVRKDLRDLRSVKSLIIVGAAIATSWYLSSFIIFLQAAYLITWMAVLTLDNISAEAAAARISAEHVQVSDEPKLFNPQD